MKHRATAPPPDEVSDDDRRRGFHCLDPWDGNHNGLEDLVRERLIDPDSMDTVSTLIAPVDSQGDHRILMEFTARTRGGAYDALSAYGWVDQDTCVATLVLLE